MLSRDDVFNVTHYALQFGIEESMMKYVVSDEIENLHLFIKQHNLSRELLKGITKMEPHEREHSEYDVIQIYNMKSNNDKKIYKVYTTERIVHACGNLSQVIISNDILFGFAIFENGYGFIDKIIKNVQELPWGFIPEFEMLADDSVNEYYADREYPCDNYCSQTEYFQIFQSSMDPYLQSIPLSLEGYIKTFRYLMENVKEQSDYVW